MPRIVRLILLSLVAVLLVLGAFVGYVAVTFDPNDYKPQVAALVKERKGRTLDVPGKISLSVFPRVGVELGRLTLSERNGNEPFLVLERAKLSLALLPLLSKRLIVDRVEVDGLQATLRRNVDGSSNFDDLLSKDADGRPSPLQFDVDGLRLQRSRLTWDDRQSNRRIVVSDVDLNTDRLADRTPSKAQLKARLTSTQPKGELTVDLKTGFVFDLQKATYGVRDLSADFRGSALDLRDLRLGLAGSADLDPRARRFDFRELKLDLAGVREGQPLALSLNLPRLAALADSVKGEKLAGSAQLTQGQGTRKLDLKFAVPSVQGSPASFRASAFEATANVKQGELDVRADLQGELSGNLDSLHFAMPKLVLALSGKQGQDKVDGQLAGRFDARLDLGKFTLEQLAVTGRLPNPAGGTLALNATGRAAADVSSGGLDVDLKGKLDEGGFDLRLGSSGAPATHVLTLAMDRLDVDRYRARAPASVPTNQRKDAGKAGGEKPIDLSALRELRARGSVRIANLKAENARLSNVTFDFKALNGRLDVNPINARLYGGVVSGSMSAQVGAQVASAPRLTLKQSLSGIHLGPLLRDAIGKDPVEGQGNLLLDLSTEGAVMAQLKKNLAGSARMDLRDGAVKGFDVGQVIRIAKSRIGAPGRDAPAQTGTGSAQDKTAFSELSASFRIRAGVARNDDLKAKSPLLRIDGSGEVDLVQDRLDYLVKATVVSTLQGQGGPELQALKGLTVPVRLNGPFAAIGYSVDFGGLASELVKKQLDTRKDEIKGRVQEQLKDSLQGPLKGLFGR